MSAFCVSNRLIVHCIFLLVLLILLLTCIYGTYKYFIFHNENKTGRPPKILSIIGPVHLLISIGALGSALIFYTVEMATCYTYIYPVFQVYMVFYCLQVYFLWLILFLRLIHVFKSSAYKISCFTENILRSILFLVPIVAICAFMPFFDSNARVIIAAILMVTSAVLCIFITGIFTYKLYKIYNNLKLNDDSLLTIITKNTLLALISVISTILNSIVLVFAWNNTDNIPLWYFKDTCFVAEMYTNFICILFTYQYFNEYYLTFCGCMDRKCKSCCGGMAAGNDIDDKNGGIEASVTTPSSIRKINSISTENTATII